MTLSVVEEVFVVIVVGAVVILKILDFLRRKFFTGLRILFFAFVGSKMTVCFTVSLGRSLVLKHEASLNGVILEADD